MSDGAGSLGAARPSIVVMKFGGTSVEDAAAMKRTAAIVLGRRQRGLQPVVVVSAMARVTDQLIAAAAAAGHDDRAGAIALSVRLRERHLNTAAQLVTGERLLTLASRLHAEFDALDDLLRGIAAVGELTPAHQRSRRQLWRAHVESNGGTGLCRSRAAGRACRRPKLHHHRRALRQGRAPGRGHRVEAAGACASAG